MAILRMVGGPKAGTEIPIDGDVVLGREGTDVVIDDPEISRRHVTLRPRAGGVEIEDLGSRNGTFLDGRRIERPTLVRTSGRIELGGTAFELSLDEPGATLVRERPTGTAATRPIPAPGGAGGDPAPVVSEAFGAFRAPPARRGRRRGVASRAIGPALVTFATIGGTAIALIAYFAQR
jgi:hypothetical protein